MPADVLMADVLVTIHLAFVAFVVLGLLLILVGRACGWRWVRNFWFRTVHLLSIAVVAAEGLAGVECPLTGWERQMRGPSAKAADARVAAGVAAGALAQPVGQPWNAIGVTAVEDTTRPKASYDALFYTAESSWVGRVSNKILFYQVPDPTWFQRGHIIFGVLVLLTFVLAPPRFPRPPGRKRAGEEPADAVGGAKKALREQPVR
jgi:hypothetical protein